MFGIFKSKARKADEENDKRAQAVLQAAAGMLETQLSLCSTIDPEQFGDFAMGDYSGGYSIGQFDAALQKAGVHVKDQEHFFCLMGDGFAYLLGCTKEEGRQVAKAFMGRERSDETASAQSRGGKEYFDLLDGKISNPTGLLDAFQRYRGAEQ